MYLPSIHFWTAVNVRWYKPRSSSVFCDLVILYQNNPEIDSVHNIISRQQFNRTIIKLLLKSMVDLTQQKEESIPVITRARTQTRVTT